jgi:transcriptional regulator with XRE-family HTH domain
MVRKISLREVREAKHMTQRELAAAAGVSQRAIVQIELGRVEPQFRTIKKLAAALGVEPQELLKGNEHD